jgi:hypothetical protein
MGPAVFAFPDCFTSLGGNQYVDSLAMGRWSTFLVDELVPKLEQTYRVRRGRAHRAVYGKSSGGYGALVQGMTQAEHWGAVACHSGDMGFERLYLRDFPATCDALARYGPPDRAIASFLEHARTCVKLRGSDFHALMILAMGASYDPDPDPGAPMGIRLPFDLRTCELHEARWAAWRAWDPVVMVEQAAGQDNLGTLAALLVDCGRRDQYFLHYGARSLAARLAAAGIAHEHDEFDDDHSSVDYRLDWSLPRLYAAIAGA